jgi:hypothetical protein
MGKREDGAKMTKPLSPRKLQQLLNAIFQAQAEELARRVNLDRGELPSLAHWNEQTQRVIQPLLLQSYQSGMIASAARIAQKLGQPKPKHESVIKPELPAAVEPNAATGFKPVKGVMPVEALRFGQSTSAWLQVYEAGLSGDGSNPTSGKVLTPARPSFSTAGGTSASQLGGRSPQGMVHGLDDAKIPASRPQLFLKGSRWLVCKAKRKGAPDVDLSFDLYNPKILDAVAGYTFVLCRETMDTATVEADEALRRLRAAMAAGLPRGDAVAAMAAEIKRIFADPYRAFRIAATEISRFSWMGSAAAAKDSGVCSSHSWLASSDACDHCLSLDGKTVKIGEPFYVDPKGGPYARVLHPPLHPFCYCSVLEEID